VLCEIASIPRKSPTGWAARDSGDTSHANKRPVNGSCSGVLEKEQTGNFGAQALDARMLAREVLERNWERNGNFSVVWMSRRSKDNNSFCTEI
jgi:hypothetical protein